MKTGRPLKYKNSEELESRINKYFIDGMNYRDVVVGTPTNRQIVKIPVPTITGLCLYLGFCDRQSFYDLEKQEEFSYTIKKARCRMEQNYEELLQTGLGAGAIFGLKNFGWTDKSEIDFGLADSIFEKFKEVSNEQLVERTRQMLTSRH